MGFQLLATHGEVIDLVEEAHDLTREFEQMRRQSNENLEGLRDVIAQIRHKLLSSAAGDVRCRRGRFSVEVERALIRFAQPVHCVSVRPRRDGKANVTIDDIPAFTLPAQLAKLLVFASVGKPDASGIAGFRTIRKARESLGTRRIDQLICRLRRTLTAHGWNPFLLETGSRCKSEPAVRFRTRAFSVIEDAAIVSKAIPAPTAAFSSPYIAGSLR